MCIFLAHRYPQGLHTKIDCGSGNYTGRNEKCNSKCFDFPC